MNGPSSVEDLRVAARLFAEHRAALRAAIAAEGITDPHEIDRQVVLRDYGVHLDIEDIRRRRGLTTPRGR